MYCSTIRPAIVKISIAMLNNAVKIAHRRQSQQDMKLYHNTLHRNQLKWSPRQQCSPLIRICIAGGYPKILSLLQTPVMVATVTVRTPKPTASGDRSAEVVCNK